MREIPWVDEFVGAKEQAGCGGDLGFAGGGEGEVGGTGVAA